MPDDRVTDIVLEGDRATEELLTLAKRLPTANLRILSLAAALAYSAEDDGVQPAYVERALKAAMRMAKGRGAKPN